MKALILTQYYPPESGAPQNRLEGLARCFLELGHPVTVLTAMPNYPAGRVFPGYERRWRCVENREGVRVIRTRIWERRGQGVAGRLVHYLSFCASALVFGAWSLGRVDVVFTESPPLFLGAVGWLFARLKGAAFIFNVSDLWPESAVAVGALRNPAFISAATWLEGWTYRHATTVTGQTEGIVEAVRRRAPMTRVELFRNGVDPRAFSPERRDRGLREEWGGDGKFIVGYAGNLGLAQGLEVVLDAADRLRGREDIGFVIVGDGADRSRLEAKVRSRKLKNVLLLGLQARDRMPMVVASFDAAVVPLRRHGLFRGAIPSKLFEAMAAEVPVLLGVEGEAAALVRKAGAGVCVPPDDGAALAEAIVMVATDPRKARELGAAGRRFVCAQATREAACQRMCKVIAEVAAVHR